jgi:hypothetical protein
VLSCDCKGSNLVCTLQNGNTTSGYNPTCAAQNNTP